MVASHPIDKCCGHVLRLPDRMCADEFANHLLAPAGCRRPAPSGFTDQMKRTTRNAFWHTIAWGSPDLHGLFRRDRLLADRRKYWSTFFCHWKCAQSSVDRH